MNEKFSKPETHTEPGMSGKDTLETRESIPTMIRGLAGDLTTLFSKEISLAKAEIREAAGHLKTALSTMAIGAMMAIAGMVVLLLAAVAGLDNVLDLWLSALIVGFVAFVMGYTMIKGASKSVEPASFVPERTIESLHQDKKAAARAMK